MTDHSDLLRRLGHFVRSEAEAQRFELDKILALPLAERVAKGFAIEGLNVAKVGRAGAVQLECQTNESRFREGDFIILHRGDPQGVEAVQCLLEYDDETLLEVTAKSGNPYFLQEHPAGWIADPSFLDLSKFFLEALDDVADTRRGRETILPLLAGEKGPGIDYARYIRGYEAAIEAGLNDSQAEAVGQAYATDLVHLIQGPPGTGKTFVLAHIVRLLVAEGQRVLVTALTHRAINNALDKIVQADPALPVCKIGAGIRGQNLQARNYENFAESGFGDLAGGYAVGATTFATRTERLAHIDFDVVIFDEASQITLPMAIMGMLAGSKYLFIGDERQLPPVITSGASEVGRTSIFGFLSSRGYETMLTTTYRLNDVLAAWPSRTFYEGKIQPSAEAAARRLQLYQPEARWQTFLDPQQPLVFLDLGHRNNKQRSRGEAELACDLVLALLQARVPAWEIGVVVPYRAQGRLVRNLLREQVSRETLKELAVDTVERMQGQEREVVLVSLTTSSPAYAEQLAQFFFQPERLNVSITRPRSKLILLGSSHVLQAEPDEPEQQAWVEMLGDLLQQCVTYHL